MVPVKTGHANRDLLICVVTTLAVAPIGVIVALWMMVF